MRDGIDEYTLLCEACGYVIEGLARDGQCPECGKPVAESLPERREGTPWQSQPGRRSFMSTVLRTIVHPVSTLEEVRFDRDDGSRYGRIAMAVSAALIALSITILNVSVGLRNGNVSVLAWSPVVLLGVFIPVAILLVCLTWIESRGLRFIGRTRGWRIDHEIASTITSIGSAGWVLAAVGPGVLIIVASAVVLIDMELSDHGEPGSGFFYRSPAFSGVGWTLLNIATIGTLITPVIGFLFFEVIAYLGLRRCKFANRTRPAEWSPQEDIRDKVDEKSGEARR